MQQVSIVLPTYNRLARLQQVVTALEQQSYPHGDLQLIIVADGATDGTNDYLAALQPSFAYIPVAQENGGAAPGRNTALKYATGDLVLFIDDDVVPGPELVAEHVAAHQQAEQAGRAGVVVLGPMLTPPDFPMSPWVQWEQAMLYKQYDAMAAGEWAPTARQFYTGNASVARSHLPTPQAFDTAFRRAEDVELAYRLAAEGLDFVFHPKAVGHHYAERSFSSWLAIAYAYGRNDVIFTREKGQPWLLATVIREYEGRHRLVKGLTQRCLSRPLMTGVAIKMLRLVAIASARMGQPSVARQAYSGIYNLRYYQGVADQLGGRQEFLARVAPVPAVPAPVQHSRS